MIVVLITLNAETGRICASAQQHPSTKPDIAEYNLLQSFISAFNQWKDTLPLDPSDTYTEIRRDFPSVS